MKRSELKMIIKECLIEILSESVNESVIKENTRNKSKAPAESVHAKTASLKKYSQPNPQQIKKNLEQKISTITSDPIMASILADTAQTTLKEQSSHESPQKNMPPHEQSRDAMLNLSESGLDVENLFEGSSMWADLAFASGPARR